MCDITSKVVAPRDPEKPALRHAPITGSPPHSLSPFVFESMAKCLVTGASGFIGTHLVRALVERGDDVRCLVRKRSQLQGIQGLPVELVHGDVTRPESLPEAVAHCSAIYHLAGLTKALSRAALDRVNAQGAENLMRAAAACTSPPVVVLVSSLAVAGPARDGIPRSPSDPCQPVSNYGRSKLAGERAAIEWAERVPLSIVRPPIVFGEGDLLSLSLFRSAGLLHLHLVPGLRARRFSFVHAADLVQGSIAAAERGKRIAKEALSTGAGIYYVADPTTPTFAEFGHLISRGFGHYGVLCIRVPHASVWLTGILGELMGHVRRKPAAMNLDKAREATAGSWTCSPESAARDLGFHPAASLPDRIRQTCQWYAREGWV